ncbi:MAG: hypothetical protein RIA63_12830 [Cyclobacteriaceae bacterium]
MAGEFVYSNEKYGNFRITLSAIVPVGSIAIALSGAYLLYVGENSKLFLENSALRSKQNELNSSVSALNSKIETLENQIIRQNDTVLYRISQKEFFPRHLRIAVSAPGVDPLTLPQEYKGTILVQGTNGTISKEEITDLEFLDDPGRGSYLAGIVKNLSIHDRIQIVLKPLHFTATDRCWASEWYNSTTFEAKVHEIFVGSSHSSCGG